MKSLTLHSLSEFLDGEATIKIEGFKDEVSVPADLIVNLMKDRDVVAIDVSDYGNVLIIVEDEAFDDM